MDVICYHNEGRPALDMCGTLSSIFIIRDLIGNRTAMIKLYDVVRIRDSGITGIVTNISSAKGRTIYTVENNKRGRTGIPGARNDDSDSFAVFDCMKGELEKVKG